MNGIGVALRALHGSPASAGIFMGRKLSNFQPRHNRRFPARSPPNELHYSANKISLMRVAFFLLYFAIAVWHLFCALFVLYLALWAWPKNAWVLTLLIFAVLPTIVLISYSIKKHWGIGHKIAGVLPIVVAVITALRETSTPYSPNGYWLWPLITFYLVVGAWGLLLPPRQG